MFASAGGYSFFRSLITAVGMSVIYRWKTLRDGIMHDGISVLDKYTSTSQTLMDQIMLDMTEDFGITLYILQTGAGTVLSQVTHFRTTVPDTWQDYFGQRRRWYAGATVGVANLIWPTTTPFATFRYGRCFFWIVLAVQYTISFVFGLAYVTYFIAGTIVSFVDELKDGTLSNSYFSTTDDSENAVMTLKTRWPVEEFSESISFSPTSSPTSISLPSDDDMISIGSLDLTLYQVNVIALFVLWVAYSFGALGKNGEEAAYWNAGFAYFFIAVFIFCLAALTWIEGLTLLLIYIVQYSLTILTLAEYQMWIRLYTNVFFFLITSYVNQSLLMIYTIPNIDSVAWGTRTNEEVYSAAKKSQKVRIKTQKYLILVSYFVCNFFLAFYLDEIASDISVITSPIAGISMVFIAFSWAEWMRQEYFVLRNKHNKSYLAHSDRWEDDLTRQQGNPTLNIFTDGFGEIHMHTDANRP